MRATTRPGADEVEELVHRHQGAVRGFLSFLGCPPDRVDDLVQDVFLSFLTARFENRGDASTRAFLRRIARNLFLKTMQRERRLIPLADPMGAEVVWEEHAEEDGGAAYLTALKACIDLLTGRPAEVLRLRYEEDLRLSSLATRLGLTESGIKSILVRTKRRLRDCVERRLHA